MTVSAIPVGMTVDSGDCMKFAFYENNSSDTKLDPKRISLSISNFLMTAIMGPIFCFFKLRAVV